MKGMKLAWMLICIIMTLGLLTGCIGGKKLTVNADAATGTFSFVDSSSNESITYNVLQVNGKEICETHVVSMGAIDILATYESPAEKTENGDILIGYEQGKDLFIENGTLLNDGSEWKYTLKEGVLNIK